MHERIYFQLVLLFERKSGEIGKLRKQKVFISGRITTIEK